MKAIKRTPIAQVSGVIIAGLLMSTPVLAAQSNSIEVTAENFTHAETARNYRNWASKGATQEFVKMQGLPPRGKAAPTVQMNDDTLYGGSDCEAR